MRKTVLSYGPAILVAMGILGATAIARLASGSGWLVLASPVFLAVALLNADIVDSRLRGKASGPSSGSWITSGAVVVASGIVAPRDPGLVASLVPILGACAAVPIVLRQASRRKACAGS